MLTSINEHTLRALQRSPAVSAALKLVEEEQKQHRRDALEQIQKSRQAHKRTEADIVARAAPLEKKLAALRAEIATVEAGLLPLADARASAMFVCDQELTRLRGELRAGVHAEVSEFQRAVELTRAEISGDLAGRRLEHLNANGPVSQEQIAAALSALLVAYREADRIAVEEIDVVCALATLRSDLQRASIWLADSAR